MAYYMLGTISEMLYMYLVFSPHNNPEALFIPLLGDGCPLGPVNK